ncbi:D-hexose-6-phosphate mutarotase [Massilia sp. S19_KUP03_FR1]|uniref:D-hexose-6-phosphate mutarotase n=1 Tax=Massilia sp. S19_KUP03_FR1 TaxID=3025503 RepID=UPI002FCD886F
MISETTFGQLPAVLLRAPDGAEAIVTLFGAHLVSWKGTDGRERLFCSAASVLDGSKAIRGGVPVIFPQFAEQGKGMRHGFARVSDWHLLDSGVEDGEAIALFTLAEEDLKPEYARAWRHSFSLALRIGIKGNTLAMDLEVRNTGEEPLAFAAALHTYFAVADVAKVRISGVAADALSIDGNVDEIYSKVAGEMAIDTGAITLQVKQSGFTDAVVWNPGAADAAALSDMEDDEYQRFVCVEPAVLKLLTLEEDDVWRGKYSVR